MSIEPTLAEILSLKWSKLTDAEKNACFAAEVAGLVPPFENREEWEEDGDTDGFRNVVRDSKDQRVPDYLHSADAVLPWLEKKYVGFPRPIIKAGTLSGYEMLTKNGKIYHDLNGEYEGRDISCAATLQECAMIALLRSKGVEVIT
jgi:hypothetical protein